MTQPIINSHSKTIQTSSPGTVLSGASSQPCFASAPRNARRFPMLVGILWVMILFIVVACLAGCAGFGAPKSSTAPPTAPSTSSLRIVTSTLPVGIQQSSYAVTLLATGGVPPYSWSQTGGQLPGGLKLNPATGTIGGTPTSAGTFTVLAKVQDSRSSSVSAAFSMDFSPAPSVAKTVAPAVAITAPSSGAAVSGSVNVSAAVTDPQRKVASLQFYLGGSPLGPALAANNPYAVVWDTTQVADGIRNLSAIATDAEGNVAMQAAIAVTVKNTSWNPAVLGVPWASDFASIAANEIDVKMDSRLKVKAAGDGVTDDTSAIRAAIQLASTSGGGVVYFPAGDYKIITPSGKVRGAPLQVPSRVILRGSTSSTSRIFVNDPNATGETDGTWTWGGIDFQGSSLSGMTDLGVYAANSSSSPCAVLWNRGSSKASEIFFNNLDAHIGNCKSVWFDSTNNLLIQNSRFDSNSSQSGPLYVVANSNVWFQNNTVTYHFGRVHMQQNTNLLVQGNTLIRDAENKDMDDGATIESGGIELSFSQGVQVLNNTFQTINGPSDEAGDGEAIMSQQSNTPDVLDAGAATSVTSTTLTDTSALWGSVTASRITQYPEVVAILTGSGTGEWRTIQGLNTSTKTLTLGQPWSPVPEVGSLYTIFVWTLMHANIQGNTLIDNPNGIVLYDGCYDCTVQNNILTNSRQILLRTVDASLDPTAYPEGRRVHQVAIASKIIGNTVSNTSGTRPAYIALDTEAFAMTGYKGMGMLNIQMAQNIINPYAANPNQSYPNPRQTEITQEGYFPCFLFGPATFKDPITKVFQNIEFSNNSQSSRISYTNQLSVFTTLSCTSPAKQ
jgi:parallel beta-helix repeat protein